MRTALALLAAVLAVLPAVQAAAPNDPLTISSIGLANGTGTLPYAGSASVTVTVTMGCLNATLAAAGSQSQTPHVKVDAVDPPAWLTVTPADITLDLGTCDAQATGTLLATGQLGLAVAAEAPGVADQAVNFTASMPTLPSGTVDSDPFNYRFNVSYHVNRTISTNLTFPHTMHGRYLNFTVTVTQTANAPSMVMVENLRATTGSVSGLSYAYYNPPETRTFQVSYKGPETAWNETAISFRAFSHYIFNATNVAGTPMLEEDYRWVVRNGNPDGGPDSEPAPMGGLPLMLLLASMALVLGRRKGL